MQTESVVGKDELEQAKLALLREQLFHKQYQVEEIERALDLEHTKLQSEKKKITDEVTIALDLEKPKTAAVENELQNIRTILESMSTQQAEKTPLTQAQTAAIMPNANKIPIAEAHATLAALRASAQRTPT